MESRLRYCDGVKGVGRRDGGTVRVRAWHIGAMRLSDREATILFVIMGRPRALLSDLIEIVYPDPDLEPDWATGNIQRAVWGLRQKMHGCGWTIAAIPGQRGANVGWRLEREAAESADLALAA